MANEKPTLEVEKGELSERQIDKRNENVPALDPADIRAAFLGPRKKIVNVGHHQIGFYDDDGERHNVTPGQAIEITARKADWFLRPHTAVDGSPGKFEVFDKDQVKRYAEIAKAYRDGQADVNAPFVRKI